MAMDYLEKKITEYINGNRGVSIDESSAGEEYSEICSLVNRLMKGMKDAEDRAEYYYESILRTPTSSFIMDGSLNIVIVNDNFVELTGYSREKLTSFCLDDFYREFSLQKISGEGSKYALEKKRRASGLFHMTFKGDRRIIQIAIDPEFDKNGKPLEVIVTLNDVMDIENQRAWYESILDAVPYPIHVTDNDMKWTFLNKAFEALLIENNEIKDRESSYGMPCSNANANICNTEKSAILKTAVSVN